MAMQLFSQRFRASRPGAVFRTAGLLLIVAALSACSSLPTPPKEQLRYDLGLAPVAAAPVASKLPPLTVADVQAGVLAESSNNMLYRLAYANAQELRPYQQARWAQPPAQLVQQRLRLLLAAQRPLLGSLDNVVANAQQQPTALLKVEIEDFSQIFDSERNSRGVVQLRATLMGMDAKGSNILLGQRAFTAQVPATSADAAGGAKAIATAADQALAELNSWLVGLGR